LSNYIVKVGRSDEGYDGVFGLSYRELSTLF